MYYIDEIIETRPGEILTGGKCSTLVILTSRY